MTTERRTALRQILSSSEEIRTANQQSLMLWGAVLVNLLVMTIVAFTRQEGILIGLGVAGTLIALSGLSFRLYIHYKHLQSDPSQLVNRLQTQLERASAVYHLSSTLSSTLDYETTLANAQEVGHLALYPKYKALNLISAALLFRQSDGKLHVATAQNLNRQDYQVSLRAKEGILAKAIEEHEPVFGGDGAKDAELRFVGAFQNAKSLLAIPLRQGYESYGVLVFGAGQVNAFDPDALESMQAIGTQVSIALKNAVLYQSILEDKERIVSIDEQARKKLSRDLHDGPTQTISLISSISSVILKYLKQNEVSRATDEVEKVKHLTDKTTKEIRHLLFSLRPLVLENKGLIAALKELASKMQETHNQQVIIDADPTVEKLLGDDEQGTVFYIIEEAINNAFKHAEAKIIWGRLMVNSPYIILEVEDNGRGFNVEAVNTDYHKRGSLGMVNLRERSEMLRGEFTINSTLGRGTKITVLIPITEKNKSKSQVAVPANETTMARNAKPFAEQSPQPNQPNSSWSDLTQPKE